MSLKCSFPNSFFFFFFGTDIFDLVLHNRYKYFHESLLCYLQLISQLNFLSFTTIPIHIFNFFPYNSRCLEIYVIAVPWCMIEPKSINSQMLLQLVWGVGWWCLCPKYLAIYLFVVWAQQEPFFSMASSSYRLASQLRQCLKDGEKRN